MFQNDNDVWKNFNKVAEETRDEEVEVENHQKLQRLGTSQKTDQRTEEGGSGFLYGHDWQESTALLP